MLGLDSEKYKFVGHSFDSARIWVWLFDSHHLPKHKAGGQLIKPQQISSYSPMRCLKVWCAGLYPDERFYIVVWGFIVSCNVISSKTSLNVPHRLTIPLYRLLYLGPKQLSIKYHCSDSLNSLNIRPPQRNHLKSVPWSVDLDTFCCILIIYPWFVLALLGKWVDH